MSRKKNSRQWARLRILCYAGLDLMTIVPDAFGLVRELIPNASAHLVLRPQLPAQPVPEAVQDGAVFSQVLPPPEGYFYSDHANFTAPTAPPVHVLETALEIGGRKRGEIVLWREEGPAFDHHDEEDLERVAGYFAQVLRNAPELGAGGAGVIEDEAMLLATGDGQILYLSDSAGALLDQLAAQERQTFDRRTVPPFCMRLVESVVHGDRYPWLLPLGTLAMGGGILEARAQWMSVGGAAALHADGDAGAASRTVGIFMKFVVPLPLRIWRAIGSVELSPQQAEVAFWMGVGGGRESARANMEVSDAVLRDCVKAVYEKFGCSSEAGLLEQLRPAISRM
ncbi:helix-turn-helix transcriptional regulator [Massilia aerilata]|uniref:Helix-turn-helix transcriptional regulator n=1 Tax=Massilia aerilata TaxID=453817 RepID=A0ABW0S5U3_9BURK